MQDVVFCKCLGNHCMEVEMKWEFEEAVLLIDLFYYTKLHNKTENENAILELSSFLGNRAKQLGYDVDDKFRNLTGIKMKLQNIEYIASGGEQGLAAYSDMDKRAYDFSLDKSAEFYEIVSDIKNKYIVDDNKNGESEVAEANLTDDVDPEEPLKGMTYSERYNLEPDLYETIKIANIPFSAQTANRLIEENIQTVADLLRKKDFYFTYMRSTKCAKEINAYLVDLCGTNTKYTMVITNSSQTFSEKYGINSAIYVEKNITDALFSVRTYNCLKNENIKTVAELLDMRVSEFLVIKGIGAKCVREVNDYFSGLEKVLPSRVIKKKPIHPRYTKLFYENKLAVATGDFTFLDNIILTDDEYINMELLKEAFGLIEEFVIDCINIPDKVTPIIETLYAYTTEQDKYMQYRKELLNVIKDIPAERMGTYAIGYINAYSDNEDIRNNLQQFYQSEKAYLGEIPNSRMAISEKQKTVLRFLKWCSFDIGQDIQQLFNQVFLKSNMKTVVEMRARNNTLEITGNALGLTRERIRQIEVKAKRLFGHWYGRTRILSKITAIRNGDNVLTPVELQDYLGEYTTELLYLLRTTDGLPYMYDSQLDVFVIDDEGLSARIQAYVDELPDVIGKKKIQGILEEGQERGLSMEVLEKAIHEGYKLTADTYHRVRLSLAAMYSVVLNKYYENGIKAYDDDELAQFREYVIDEFGNVNLPLNNRALTARIADVCVLSGKGIYRPKRENYIPKALAARICRYIEESENIIFLTNTLFSVFEDELIVAGIDNKYYLQGVMHELYGDKFIFRRDYISKDESVTSVYMDIVKYIKNFDYPISKKQIKDAYPGITEVVINFSVSDPSIVNFFGEYMYGSKLNLFESDKKYLESALRSFLTSEGYCNCRDFFDYIDSDEPTILKRLFVLSQFSLFSVLEYLFREEYQFLRPYIALNGVNIAHPAERLRELIVSADEITIEEIKEFSKENYFQIPSILEFVNSYNDTHLLKNNDILASIDSLGIDRVCALAIEKIILNEITEITVISQLASINSFPKISAQWTEWLIYSVINKWSEKLEVGTTSNQFRMSKPVVALKGYLNVQELSEMDTAGVIVEADDLEDIDHLIAGYIEEEIGDLENYEL